MRINESMVGGGRDDGESVLDNFFPERYVNTKHCCNTDTRYSFYNDLKNIFCFLKMTRKSLE